MSLPTFVLATLSEINGTSCGSLSHRMKLEASSDPPEYFIDGSGDFQYANLKQVTKADASKTWDITIVYLNSSSPCTGIHTFRRDPSADDPTGNFCIRAGSGVDCSKGKASIVDDS